MSMLDFFLLVLRLAAGLWMICAAIGLAFRALFPKEKKGGPRPAEAVAPADSRERELASGLRRARSNPFQQDELARRLRALAQDVLAFESRGRMKTGPNAGPSSGARAWDRLDDARLEALFATRPPLSQRAGRRPFRRRAADEDDRFLDWLDDAVGELESHLSVDGKAKR